MTDFETVTAALDDDLGSEVEIGFDAKLLLWATAIGLCDAVVAVVGTTFGAETDDGAIVDAAVVTAVAATVDTAPAVVVGGVVLIGLLFLRGVCFVRGDTGAFDFGDGEGFRCAAGIVASFGGDTVAGTAIERFDLSESGIVLIDAFNGTATFDALAPLSPVAT